MDDGTIQRTHLEEKWMMAPSNGPISWEKKG